MLFSCRYERDGMDTIFGDVIQFEIVFHWTPVVIHIDMQ